MTRKINVDGKWYEIEIETKEMEKIREKSIEENIIAAQKVMDKCPAHFPKEIVAVLVEQATQHWKFRADEVITRNIKKNKER
jgi:hypothetical protein